MVINNLKFNDKKYLIKIINRNNNIGEYVNDQSEIPDKKIKKVAGNIAFQERKSRVNHIYEFPDLAIVQASKTIIHQHFKDVAFPQEIILEQVSII